MSYGAGMQKPSSALVTKTDTIGRPGPPAEQLSEGTIAQVVDEYLQQFGHKPRILICDSEPHIVGHSPADNGVTSGMVLGGKIHLFRGGRANTAEVVRTLRHEMLHYGLRRFMERVEWSAVGLVPEDVSEEVEKYTEKSGRRPIICLLR